MQIIDVNIKEIQSRYNIDRKIQIENIDFGIGRICGARNEFILFNKGKQHIVFQDNEEEITAFIIIN